MPFKLSKPSPDEIYAASLQSLCLGRPMWYPEPHEAGEPQLGDVGFIEEGAFVKLFNIHENEPNTFWPVSFNNEHPFPREPLRIDKRSGALAPRPYPSHGVEIKTISAGADITAGPGVSAGVSADYKCHASAGAVLVLKSEADSARLFDHEPLKRYILQQHDSWYTYVQRDLGQSLRQKGIVVVRGWVKTSADWAVAAFSKSELSGQVAAHAGAAGVAGAHIAMSSASSTSDPAVLRYGRQFAQEPQDRDRSSLDQPPTPSSSSQAGSPAPPRDQCVFLRRYKLRKRWFLPSKIVAGAGYDHLPDGRDGRDAFGAEDVTDVDEEQDVGYMWRYAGEGGVPDPLDVLLDYMLEVTSARVVLASDDDVAVIASGKPVIDLASYLRWLQPPVMLDGEVGFLHTEDIVRHRQLRELGPRRISYADRIKWAGISPDGSGRVKDLEVFKDETDDKPRKVKTLLLSSSDRQKDFCFAFAHSPDGKLIAASVMYEGVLVWRASDGMLLQRLQYGIEITPMSITFSPRGTEILCGYKSAAVAWDVASGEERLRVEGCSSINAIAYSPDGRLIAAVCSDDFLKVWDSCTGEQQHSFGPLSTSMPHTTISFVQAEASCKILIQCFDTIEICDIQSGALSTLVEPGAKLFSALSPQGDRVVVARTPGKQWPEVWSTLAEDHKHILTLKADKPVGAPVGFSSDGKEVFSACNEDKTMRIFDAWTGTQLRWYQLRGSGLWKCVYSPDGVYIAVVGVGNEILLYSRKYGHNTNYAARFHALDINPALTLAFLADNRTLVIYVNEYPIQVVDVCAVLETE